jgi:hypothetical protein
LFDTVSAVLNKRAVHVNSTYIMLDVRKKEREKGGQKSGKREKEGV